MRKLLCIVAWLVVFGIALSGLGQQDNTAVETEILGRAADVHTSLLASRVDLAGLIQLFEYRSAALLPIVVPGAGPAYPALTDNAGVMCFDPNAFPDSFLKGLESQGIVRNGVMLYPVRIREALGPGAKQERVRIVETLAGNPLALVPAPPEYDSAFYAREMFDRLPPAQQTRQEFERLCRQYDPARIEVTAELLSLDGLTAYSVHSAVASIMNAPGTGGGAMMAMGATAYSNLQFTAIVRAPATNGVVVTLGFPENMTNTEISVFACTNLVEPEWGLIAVTNTPSSTNLVQYHDESATNFIVRYYNAACFAGTLHPQTEDFESGKAGRVMISTLHDDNYYTVTDTTIADEPAQTEDGKVTITAHLPKFCEGQTVYFHVVTPDPDDLSPYEPNTTGGDNRDTNIVAGVLNASNDVAELETINGTEVAAAEVELTITDQYAGDNYQVEFSLDSDFSRILDRTAVMVAWKRIYIEEDQMYRKGADLASDFIPDTNALPDSLTVVSRTYGGGVGISVGDDVLVFDADIPYGETATVTSIVDMTLYLDTDLTNSYNAGYGAGDKGAAVAVPDPDDDEDIDVFDPEVELFTTNAYGFATDGADGGCFVEFVKVESGSTPVPYRWSLNYWSNWATPWTTYVPVWFENRQKPNFLYVLSGQGMGWQYLYGFNYGEEKASIILVGNIESAIPSADRRTFNGETVVHELGHTWASPPMDDSHPHDARAHDDSDYCVMDYGPSGQLKTIFSNGKTEFCIDGPNHLYEVRDKPDGF